MPARVCARPTKRESLAGLSLHSGLESGKQAAVRVPVLVKSTKTINSAYVLVTGVSDPLINIMTPVISRA